ADLLTCSTGVIGEPLHLDRLLGAVPALASELDGDGGAACAAAILTTDTVVKQATADADAICVGGAAKGVGMISPNLATMLAFVTTDAAVTAPDAQQLVRTSLPPAFNAITVDGCTSTNDTALLFASGAAGEERVEPGRNRSRALACAGDDAGASAHLH